MQDIKRGFCSLVGPVGPVNGTNPWWVLPAKLCAVVINQYRQKLMVVAYLRDSRVTTLRIVLASSEVGKGLSYCVRVMGW